MTSIGEPGVLGPGSKVFGDLTIGDNVAVGANAVVTKSVPARAVVGPPARTSSYGDSFAILEYPGMDTDLDRQASLTASSPDRKAAIAPTLHLEDWSSCSLPSSRTSTPAVTPVTLIAGRPRTDLLRLPSKLRYILTNSERIRPDRLRVGCSAR